MNESGAADSAVTTAGQGGGAGPRRLTIRGLRWWIVGLVFVASVLNYVDRQALSLLAPTIQQELKLTNDDYAGVVNLFLVAYMIAYFFSGRLVDKLGVRVSFALFVGWWSIANITTAFAKSVTSLGAFRFLLGLGEAGNWTAAPKAVSEWFPAKERGLAIGLYTLGATIGATIAPIIVIGLATTHGWRMAFVVTGAAGLVWLIPWLWLYRRPEVHPHLGAEERALIEGGRPPISASDQLEPATEWARWRAVFARREVWLLMTARLVTDPVWYFFQFWFAKYLYDVRGVDQKALAITWVIFLAADFGSVGGGWFSGQLIKRGFGPPASRVWIMLGTALVVPMAAFIPSAPTVSLVLVLGMLIVFAQLSWQINLSSLVVDLVPQRSLGLTFGVIAAGSALGGIFMNKGVAWAITNVSYAPCFFVMGLVHPAIWLLLRFFGPASFRAKRVGVIGT